jgi:hypothetical protein
MPITNVSWGLIGSVVSEGRKALSKAKFHPGIVICARPKDFLIAGWMFQSSSVQIGSVVGYERLMQGRCKLLLLSLDNDPSLADITRSIHTSSATLPFLYQLKTLTLFDVGFPSYDFNIFQIPYNPTYPWETSNSGEGSRIPSNDVSPTHIQPSPLFEKLNSKGE